MTYFYAILSSDEKKITKKREKTSYLQEFIEYQDKMYLPGYYLGGRLPPFLRAKTKAGGYFLLATGIIALVSSLNTILNSQFSPENISAAVVLFYGILALLVGWKFIKINKN